MKLRRSLVVGIALILIAVGLATWAYPHLPPIVPTHWDAYGHVNGYASRFWALAPMPIAMAVTLLLMIVLPAISPKGFRIDRFREVFNAIVLAAILMLLALYVIVLRAQLWNVMPAVTALTPCIGLLFIVIGNYMGKLQRNFFIGIRTPWTLASDEVWLRTHRLGGRLFLLGGLVFIACAFLPIKDGIIAILSVVIAILIATTLYSYICYARIEGFKPNAS